MRSLLTDKEIVVLYSSGERISSIQALCGTSRQSVYNCLTRNGTEPARRAVLDLVCKFCGEKFTRLRSHNKGNNSGYCSVQCFHASRSLGGEYSRIGGSISRTSDANPLNNRSLGRAAMKAIKESGIVLKAGEVVHHIDGDRTNNEIGNLRVFKNHSEHMKFHHSLRKKL